jgi:sugar phosphate permease
LADLSNSHFKDLNRYRWLMFGIMGIIYFLACLHRIAPTVIARDLMLEFGADATALGLMSSAYFYLYAAIQPPVGMLSDTLGPRRVITIFTLIAGAGTIFFGAAANMPMAALGRSLIGIGVGGIFVPGLKIFSRWYRAKAFAGVTGIFLAMGNAGNLSGSLPLTYLVLLLGWRLSFIGIGGLSLLLAVLGWIILRDRPEDKGWKDSVIAGDDPSPPPQPIPMGMTFQKRLRIVFGHPAFWMITLSYFFYGGPALTFQGLWAVPYLMDIHGFSQGAY